MKKILACLVIVFSVFLLSGFIPESKEHDSKLVGVWKGFEKDKQIEGIEKHWILQRFDSGKYVIMFTTKQDCEIETFSENGEWWTKDGKFYEKSQDLETPDIYSYEVMDKIVINFKSIELMGEKKIRL